METKMNTTQTANLRCNEPGCGHVEVVTYDPDMQLGLCPNCRKQGLLLSR